MGTIIKPLPVKLIIGMISGSLELFEQARGPFQRLFGPIDYTSPIIDFDFTDYYQSDMGIGLKRRFLSFKRLIDPRKLAGIKVLTNRLERRVAGGRHDVKRPVNFDPGYINQARLILASSKDYSHRIYIGKGIYAEVTLIYRDNTFRPLEWTYPDYRSASYIEIFSRIRSLYIEDL